VEERDAAGEAAAGPSPDGAGGRGAGGEVPRGEAAAVGAVRGRDPGPGQEDPDLAGHVRLGRGRGPRLRRRSQDHPRRRRADQLPLRAHLRRGRAAAAAATPRVNRRRGGCGDVQPQQHRGVLERRRRARRDPPRRGRPGRRGGLPQLLRLLLVGPLRGRRVGSRLRRRGRRAAAVAVRSERAGPGGRRHGLALRHAAPPLAAAAAGPQPLLPRLVPPRKSRSLRVAGRR
jgi:hypothetical protein